jgi:alpha-glucuronidase
MIPENLSRRTILQAAALLTATAAGGVTWPGNAFAAGRASLEPEDGYDLWLRYRLVEDNALLATYQARCAQLVVEENDPLVLSARDEVRTALSGLTGTTVPVRATTSGSSGAIVLGTWSGSTLVRQLITRGEVERNGPEGFVVKSVSTPDRSYLVVASTGAPGVLYGAFALLRVLQRRQALDRVNLSEQPAAELRLANHWDNLNGTVERGYAGASIFEWADLPKLDPRYTDYARALASIGMNGTVVNNVNANPQFLTSSMIQRLAALAGALRPWGVRFYLSANFAAPLALRELPTADPLDPRVQAWWRDKAAEIWRAIPDFGGFLVKANSEGQPGPIDYGRTHADGANTLARAVAPHGGIIMWRTFVYDSSSDVAKYAYQTFTPLDGKFDDNVVLQAKYGPVDFHIREPIHPLFGAMPKSNMMLELQITQEHTGHETDLNYLPVWWKQVLDFDTHAQGPGSTVAKVVDGSLFGYTHAGSAGVMNFGNNRNWTGSHLAAANTHGYGRLLWSPNQSPADLATEWTEMSFGTDAKVTGPITAALLTSWKTFEDYTSPLGVGNMVAPDSAHYDPDPVASQAAHRSDEKGTGYDRTRATGDGFTGLYFQPWRNTYESLATMPDELLMFMHHVPYGHRLQSGRTVIDHIYESHFSGLEKVRGYQQAWDGLEGRVDTQRFDAVAATFERHVAHATLWRDTIVGYFFSLSRILGTTRSWLQVKVAASDTLLLGGWPTRIGLNVGNASPRALSITARLDADSPWQTRGATAQVASKEFADLTVTAVPPNAGATVTKDLAVTAGGLPVLGATDRGFTTTPAPQLCHLALDAGTSTSPTFAGYERLEPSSSWDAARGYGWVSGTPQSRDRGAPDALRRDFCNGPTPATLRVAVPPGSHDTYLLVGDNAVGSAPTIVTSGTTELGRTESLDGAEFAWLHFTLDGGTSGRPVDLTLSSTSGAHWHLDALAIVDETANPPAVVIGDATPDRALMLPDEPVSATFWLYNFTSDDVTVHPTVQVPDGYTATPESAQVTVPGNGDTEFTATVTRSAATSQGGVLALEIDGDRRNLELVPSDNWVRVAALSASSTHAPSSVDNLNDGNTDSSAWGGGGAGGWNDGTPGSFPDTVTASWPHSISLSRVKVFTLDSSAYPAAKWGVRDYDIQARSASGTWSTVAQVRGNQTGTVETRFTAVQTDGLRINILDTNDHQYSRLLEIEAYPS